jgi:hypothetical protein
VLDGLAEGEQVVMNPRTQFAEELSRLVAEQPRQARAPDADVVGAPAAEEGSASDVPAPPRNAAPPTAPGSAPAAGPPRGGDPAARFQKLDRNGDGRLTRDELPPPLRDRLATLDRNGDGAVARDEWESVAASLSPPARGPR